MSVGEDQAIRRAAQLHRQGQFDDAARHYIAILSADPVHFDALRMLGLLRFQQGRHTEALDCLQAALNIDPAAAAVLAIKGAVHVKLNQPAQALACYDRVVALEPANAEALNNRGNVLKELQRYEEALASYDAALALMPDNPEALNNRGVVLQDLMRLDAAIASLDRALVLRPGDPETLNNRGMALQRLRRFDAAVASYDQALSRDPDFADALNNRGTALHAMQQFERAVASYDRAIVANPANAEAYGNRGNALHALRRLDEAVASYDQALAIRPDFADARYAKSLCLLLQGDFENGWRAYESRWDIEQLRHGRRHFAQPLWRGDADLAGRAILLYAEQGFGDTLQFCRFARRVAQRGAEVVLEVQAPLKSLIASLDPAIAVIAAGEALPAFDCRCPLMSLPLALELTPDTIPRETPYLSAPWEKMQRWRGRLGPQPQPRIGLVWAGSSSPGLFNTNSIDSQRSLSFDQLAPLFDATQGRFYSLQKGGDAVAQLRRSRFAPRVVDWTDELVDFADTAALVATLDLVITVDTAVAHVAGALGKPFWLINRFSSCWRWGLAGDTSAWYPTARIFRQRSLGDWAPVVAGVADALRQWSDA